ncbi:MAG: DsbE family thiol:disulfide interchange protein [Acidiferrobacteraceae bacterium]
MKKFLVPVGIFAVVGGLLFFALIRMQTGDYSPRTVPSPLIGKPVPAFKLTRLDAPGKTITPQDLYGRVYLLNVWASWCVACREEHPVLMEISRSHLVPLIGLNYKDQDADARAVLKQRGNPYEMILRDPNGRAGINLGVYGVPETFLIDGKGVIRYKFIGPITDSAIAKTLMPLVRRYSSSASGTNT